MSEDDDRFDTPEEAALAEWAATPKARAKVISVRIDGDEAVVIIETAAPNPDYNKDYNTCRRDPDGRWFLAYSNG
jgi:hypothetical protein